MEILPTGQRRSHAYRIENPTQRCHDCGRKLQPGEWVIVRRQISGGDDGQVYGGDFGEVVVCRDRRLCGNPTW